MTKYIVSVAIFFLGIFMCGCTCVATSTQTSSALFQSLNSAGDVFDVLERIKLGGGTASHTSSTTEDTQKEDKKTVGKALRNGWDDMNTWMKNHVGTSIQDVLRYVVHILGNVFNVAGKLFYWIESKI